MEQAGKVFDDMGMTMSEGIRTFLREVIARRDLPFEPTVPISQTVPKNQLHIPEFTAAD